MEEAVDNGRRNLLKVAAFLGGSATLGGLGFLAKTGLESWQRDQEMAERERQFEIRLKGANEDAGKLVRHIDSLGGVSKLLRQTQPVMQIIAPYVAEGQQTAKCILCEGAVKLSCIGQKAGVLGSLGIAAEYVLNPGFSFSFLPETVSPFVDATKVVLDEIASGVVYQSPSLIFQKIARLTTNRKTETYIVKVSASARRNGVPLQAVDYVTIDTNRNVVGAVMGKTPGRPDIVWIGRETNLAWAVPTLSPLLSSEDRKGIIGDYSPHSFARAAFVGAVVSPLINYGLNMAKMYGIDTSSPDALNQATQKIIQGLIGFR